MPEVNSLVLQVKSDSVGKATGRLDKFSTSATKTAATTRTLGSAVKSALGPLLALASVTAGLKKTFSSTVELQDFNAQLKTATGSVEDATIAFDALEQIASSTPYALEQSLEAFIKLTNLGLTPSERAIMSYGNTASAMGKDLTQLIEAVADATTGEFERLKEFGIKAKSEGDNVSFTFRGLTTTIGKNAAEIEAYLMALGENEFAGAMADRMATVGGQVSNLGDLWGQLFRTISEQGAGELIGDSLQIGIDSLTEIIAILDSGQFEASINSWTVAYEGWADDFAVTSKFVSDLMAASGEESGESFTRLFIGSLKTLPIHFRNTIQRVFIELASIVDYGEATIRGLIDVFNSGFGAIIGSAGLAGDAIGKALNPFDDTDFSTALKQGLDDQKALFNSFGEEVAVAYIKAERAITATREARLGSIEDINTEFNADLERVAALELASESLRATYDREKEAKSAARASGAAGDSLAGFKITPEDEIDGLKKLDAATVDSYNNRLNSAESYFSEYSGLANENNEKLSSIGKTALATQKGLAIAQTTMKSYEMATSAYSSLAGIPYVGPALGAAAAAAAITYGLANVAAIGSTVVGGFENGGIIPGGSFSGDNLTANVNSGEMVINRAQQARLFSIANSGNQSSTGSGVNVFVENYGSSEIEVQQINENDIRIIAKAVVREDAPAVIAGDLANANSRTSKSLQSNTKTERRR